ncbi:MAG: tetratricopeptide repeat protein, partial [Lentisphaerota bacterium]
MNIPKLYQDAKQGNADAQYNLGLCLKKGDGVEKNLVEAVKWFRKAAVQGHAQGQLNLGVCLKKGDGVEKNLVEAVK